LPPSLVPPSWRSWLKSPILQAFLFRDHEEHCGRVLVSSVYHTVACFRSFSWMFDELSTSLPISTSLSRLIIHLFIFLSFTLPFVALSPRIVVFCFNTRYDNHYFAYSPCCVPTRPTLFRPMDSPSSYITLVRLDFWDMRYQLRVHMASVVRMCTYIYRLVHILSYVLIYDGFGSL